MDKQERLDFVKSLFSATKKWMNHQAVYEICLLKSPTGEVVYNQAKIETIILPEAERLLELAQKDDHEYKNEIEELAIIYIKYKIGIIKRKEITEFDDRSNEFEFLSLD